jgi:membrane-associated phospholipid phosphatase
MGMSREISCRGLDWDRHKAVGLLMQQDWMLRSALLFAMLGQTATAIADADDHRRAGDVLRFAMPAGVAAYELWRGDTEGVWQFGKSWAVTLGATEALKRITRVERPDRSNHESFPSGHASHAFAAATYMHRRHGIAEAWPWYVAATYVGWTRVHAHRHRWGDVAGSAVLAGASTWWLVEPAGEQMISVIPTVAPGLLAVHVHARW